MKIVGVGQMFNFQTGEVEDRVQIVTSIGSQFSIPTTNEGAALLVKMAMASRQHPTKEEREEFGLPSEEDDYYEDADEAVSEEMDGVHVFGGNVDDEEEMPEPRQMRMTPPPRAPSLGKTSNPPDRSGVPSFGISRVDESGNPILPEAPAGIAFEDDDEEDDPGESI